MNNLRRVAPIKTRLDGYHATLVLIISLLLCVACDSDGGDTSAGEMAGEVAGVMAGEVAGVMAGEVAGVMAGDTAGDVAGEIGGDVAGEIGGTEAVCLGGSGYGLNSLPVFLNLEGVGPFTTPQLIPITGGGWLLGWLSGTIEEPTQNNTIHVIKLDESLTPQGPATQIARARGGQYQLHSTSTGAMLVWINQRSTQLSNEGVYMQALDAQGALSGEYLTINQTYDVRSIDSKWMNGFGGIITMIDSSKVSVVTFQTEGLSSEVITLAEETARAPTATFAGGSWSVGWLSAIEGEAGKYQIQIAQITDQGALQGEIKTLADAESTGQLSLVYGNGIYAVAWTLPDPTSLETIRRKIIGFNLLDETLNKIGSFFVTDGTTDLTLHGLSWVDPSIFTVNWSQSPLSNNASVLGISRINQLGQVLPPIVVERERELITALGIQGNASAMRLILSVDTDPQPTGLYSADTFIQTVTAGPCEE